MTPQRETPLPAPGSHSRELVLLLVAVLGVLALFANKAYTIDDTLFLYLGKHLQSQPFDFYGFAVNWYGHDMPMSDVTKNPPLAGYWIAAMTALFGWSEVALHATFLLPAAAAASATYLLARRFTARPLLASLLGLLTPVFLISSTNVMCDTTMLAFWCWALLTWMWGFDTGRARWLWLAGLLASLTILSKYFGIALVPLLLVHGALRARKLGAWLLPLLLPLATMVAYQLATKAMYGRGLLLDAAEYANLQRHEGGTPLVTQFFVGFVFAGGCVATTLVHAPLIWSKRVLALMLAVCVLGMVAVYRTGALQAVGGPGSLGLPPLAALQMALMGFGGMTVVALVIDDLRRHREPDDVLLALWVLGTFVFAAMVNWVNNGRSNLPLAPAVGILLARRLAHLEVAGELPRAVFRQAALAVSFLLAGIATWADYAWAGEVRHSARELASRYAREGRTLWYQGHWGFQYYMDDAGATALDVYGSELRRGDRILRPMNNVEMIFLDSERFEPEEEHAYLHPSWVRTMSPSLGAGFYASNIGAMPFAFGRPYPDMVQVWRARQPIGFKGLAEEP